MARKKTPKYAYGALLLLACIVLALLNFSASLNSFLAGAPQWLLQPSTIDVSAHQVAGNAIDHSIQSLPFNYSDQSQASGTVSIQRVNHSDQSQAYNLAKNSTSAPLFVQTARKFFIADAPEMSAWLLRNHSGYAIEFYNDCLNEEAIEIWLHRGFERLSRSRTFDATEAAAILIPYYGHLTIGLRPKPDAEEFAERLLRNNIHDKSKPHILLCPSNNPQRGRDAGIGRVMGKLKDAGVNIWSVGIERNPSWQSVEPERIVPVPYLVKPSGSSSELKEVALHKRKNSSIFYAGDVRPNAIAWAGCNRSMVEPLKAEGNAVIKLFRNGEDRVSQSEYNEFMKTMEFCLILCGDTPTSRSLASSVIHGCIPLRIGSRLRGLCEKPCKRGFGWRITGPRAPHLPYSDRIPWSAFPEVNEADFIKAPIATLRTVLDSYTRERKQTLREILAQIQLGWIYGWGSPVTSSEFGAAAEYVWDSFLFMLDAL